VALKVPKLVAREPERIKRFLTEAKAAARLHHPNIVAIFETGEADGVNYIATEFVSGEPLSRRLKRDRPSLRQAAQWVRDLALALAYAHGEGVIHRDIKPANIMIDSGQRPQLMDFGMAKVLAEAAPAAFDEAAGGAFATTSIATVDGTIMGTPAYMAPEQARGDVTAVGPQSDQYSLGVVFYELLTGRRPVVKVRAGAIVAEVPARPRKLTRKVPRDLEAICLKAIAKEPDDRYASAADLAVDLQHWLQADPVVARPFTLFERAVLWWRRNPKLATAVFSAAAIMAVTLVYVTLQLVLTRIDLSRTQLALEMTRKALKQKTPRDTPLAPAQLAAEHDLWERWVQEAEWSALTPDQVHSAAGSTLKMLEDRSILASGKNPAPETYTVTASTKLDGVSAVRLEVLTDPSLPNGGPGRSRRGNITLNDFEVSVCPPNEPEWSRPAVFQRALADYSQPGYPVESLVGPWAKYPIRGWAIERLEGHRYTARGQTAVFVFRDPVASTRGMTLTFKLDHRMQFQDAHNIGRFRLSATTAKLPANTRDPPPR
jgi:hypothetical protein